jgi:hypothetical protein
VDFCSYLLGSYIVGMIFSFSDLIILLIYICGICTLCMPSEFVHCQQKKPLFCSLAKHKEENNVVKGNLCIIYICGIYNVLSIFFLVLLKSCEILSNNLCAFTTHGHRVHKSMCYNLHVHVFPFFKFYRGA